jgi:hypothetical protein
MAKRTKRGKHAPYRVHSPGIAPGGISFPPSLPAGYGGTVNPPLRPWQTPTPTPYPVGGSPEHLVDL